MACSQQETDSSGCCSDDTRRSAQHSCFQSPELSDLQQQIAYAGRPKATASVRVGQA